MANLPHTAPAVGATAVTPSDSVDLDPRPRALWIGGAGSGNLKVDMANGDTVTFAGVPVGLFPIAVTRVYATGTDVTNIVALV